LEGGRDDIRVVFDENGEMVVEIDEKYEKKMELLEE
jgi:hypothetical protein